MPDPIHEDLTRKHGYSYVFTAKHHGGGAKDDACWSKDITRAEEFHVFDEAVYRDVVDESGRFYGVLPDADGKLRDLGTWQQQMAEFPPANEGVPWHGYPIWALNELAPGNRSGQKVRPAKEVFVTLEQVGLLTAQQRKRLYKGDHA